MIRLTALALVVTFLCGYAFRDWFRALCGLILLTTFSQHPSLPRTMFGVPGLNPWNLLFFVILLAWVLQRRPSNLPVPGAIRAGVFVYLLLLVVGAARAMIDAEPMAVRGVHPGNIGLLFGLIANPLKYCLVGLLLFDGCRTDRDVKTAVHTLLLFGLAHALMMYKTMKTTVFTGNFDDARRLTDKLIGLHAVDLAGLLTFAFWSFVLYGVAVRRRKRWFAVVGALVVVPTVIGCYSRAAFLSNGVLALVLGVVRWRRFLLLAPLLGVLVIIFYPHVTERMWMGFDQDAVYQDDSTDWNAVTAGRTKNIWEPVIEQIGEAPLFGFGRMAIWREACYAKILERELVVPSHPHSSYLELVLDHGIIGALCVLSLIGCVFRMSLQLMRFARPDSLTVLVGGIGFVATLNALVLGLSSTFFYPKESALWLICSVALVTRVWSWHALRIRGYGHAGRNAAIGTVAGNTDVDR